jgi:hypothetical protein
MVANFIVEKIYLLNFFIVMLEIYFIRVFLSYFNTCLIVSFLNTVVL